MPLATRAPFIDNKAPTLDETLEIKPPVKVDRPVTPKVLESVAAPVAASVPPTDTLLPTVVAAKAPAEGINATIAASAKDRILLLLDIVFIDSF